MLAPRPPCPPWGSASPTSMGCSFMPSINCCMSTSRSDSQNTAGQVSAPCEKLHAAPVIWSLRGAVLACWVAWLGMHCLKSTLCPSAERWAWLPDAMGCKQGWVCTWCAWHALLCLPQGTAPARGVQLLTHLTSA